MRDAVTSTEAPQLWTGFNSDDHMQLGPTVERRLKIYREFMGVPLRGRSLDMGRPNRIGRELGVQDNAEGNFNYQLITKRAEYDTILHFEVIEHLMNPLLNLTLVKTKLAKTGSLFLSTPLCPIMSQYIERHHFTEYKENRLLALFDEAGFIVVRKKIFPLIPFGFTGIRPLFKWMIWKTILVELRHKP